MKTRRKETEKLSLLQAQAPRSPLLGSLEKVAFAPSTAGVFFNLIFSFVKGGAFLPFRKKKKKAGNVVGDISIWAEMT